MGSFLFEIFVKLGLSSAALDKGLAQTKLKVQQTAREVRKETGQARDATALLGRMFGMTLPAQVQKFAASVAPVRQLLAGAFNAALVGTFAAAVGVAVVKGVQWFESIRTGTRDLEVFAKALGQAEVNLSKLSLRQLDASRQSLRGQLAAVEADLGLQFGAVQSTAQARGVPEAIDFWKRLFGVGREAQLQQLASLINRINAVSGAMSELNDEARKNALAGSLKAAKEEAGALAKLMESQARSAERLGDFFRQLRMKSADHFRELARRAGPPEIPGLPVSIENLMRSPEALKRMFPLMEVELDRITLSVGRMKQAFESALESVGDALDRNLQHWRGWGNMLVDVLNQVGGALIRNLTGGSGTGGLFSSLLGAIIRGFGGGGGGFSFAGGIPLNLNRTGGISLTPRQYGGSALAGRALLVGERGPEIFTPGVSGQITPNHALRGGRGGERPIMVNLDARGADIGTVAKISALVHRHGFEEGIRQMVDRASRTP